jgi:large subunit ribosomal protein L21
MSYAIISLGGKQYTVREGQRLLVDRLPHDEGKTFTPQVLLVGGDGDTKLAPSDVTVTATVLGPALGEKIRIGKYRPKNGYRKHTGFRASLSQIEIESIGAAKKSAPKKETAAKAEAPKAEAPKTEAKAAAPAADDHVKGMPKGYEELTIAQIKEQVSGWNRPMLEAALEYEQAHGARKGAIAELEGALAEKEQS